MFPWSVYSGFTCFLLYHFQSNSRDPERNPMQWNTSKNAGFTFGDPWLNVTWNTDYEHVNVEVRWNSSFSEYAVITINNKNKNKKKITTISKGKKLKQKNKERKRREKKKHTHSYRQTTTKTFSNNTTTIIFICTLKQAVALSPIVVERALKV